MRVVFSGPLGNSGGDWFNPSIQFSDSPNIDHGKPTLADRLIEHTRTVPEQDMRAQMLGRNETIGKLVILLLLENRVPR